MKLLAAIIIGLIGLTAVGQQPAASPTPAATSSTQGAPTSDEVGEGEILRISANLVTVPVTVINRQGQYVVDLKQSEFHLYEEGEEQTIVHFSNVDRPFSVALLLDTSGSTAPFLNQIKGAAKLFMNSYAAWI